MDYQKEKSHLITHIERKIKINEKRILRTTVGRTTITESY